MISTVAYHLELDGVPASRELLSSIHRIEDHRNTIRILASPTFPDDARIRRGGRIRIWVTIDGEKVLLADARIDRSHSDRCGSVTIARGAIVRDDRGTHTLRIGEAVRITSPVHDGTRRSPKVVEGVLDTSVYLHVLFTGDVVRLEGVGDTYGGLYYVDQVTHCFEAQGYRQTFKLTRNETS